MFTVHPRTQSNCVIRTRKLTNTRKSGKILCPQQAETNRCTHVIHVYFSKTKYNSTQKKQDMIESLEQNITYNAVEGTLNHRVC
jgi:hypothetical protein